MNLSAKNAHVEKLGLYVWYFAPMAALTTRTHFKTRYNSAVYSIAVTHHMLNALLIISAIYSEEMEAWVKPTQLEETRIEPKPSRIRGNDLTDSASQPLSPSAPPANSFILFVLVINLLSC